MNGVLIVDDDREYRESLIRELSKSKRHEVIEGASSGEEAVKLITRRPQDFRFAVIDHVLGKGMDGIETTSELVKICPSLYPVVFSNLPKDEKLMEYKYKALEAGAFRYLETKDDGPRKISEFVKEMEQLEHLRNWVADFHAARSAAPSLLTQFDVGMDIIDRHYKVWFMNDAQRRITGFEGPGLPKAPCAQWHGLTCLPCDGCIVNQSFQDDKPRSNVFLSHFTNRNDKKLFFLRVWSQVVNDPMAPLGRDDKPVALAVMESVLELTGTSELKAMPLDERLGIVAKAMWSLREGEYSHTHRFEYVRIYVVDGGGTGSMILKAAAGTRQPSHVGLPVNLRGVDGQRLGQAEGHTRETSFGYWFQHVDGFDPVMPAYPRIPFIYWPISDDSGTIAVMELGGLLIKMNTAEVLPPYAEEVWQAIIDDRDRDSGSLATGEAVRSVAEVDLALQTRPRSAEEQLKEIVRSACQLTDSDQYVFRYRDGDNAKLLRLGVPDFSAFEDVASPSYPLSFVESWSCRTILAGTESLANTAEQHDMIMAFCNTLEERPRRILAGMNSMCCEPLILESFCIGSIGFHARTVTNYSEKKLAILRLLAKRAAWALQDYLMARAIRERAEADAQAQVLGVVLHSLNTPLASIQIDFSLLVEAFDSEGKKTVEMADLVERIKGELSKISRLRDTVLKLRKSWDTRVEEAQLHELVRKVVTGRLDRGTIQPDFTLAPALQDVLIDSVAVQVCLEVLLDNAIDAMKERGKKTLRIVLREAEATKLGRLAIDVIDKGLGVPPDMRERLFTTMQSEKVKGTGIGLLHCRAIARSAHGDVTYDHTHSPGAKFTLILPYKKKGA